MKRTWSPGFAVGMGVAISALWTTSAEAEVRVAHKPETKGGYELQAALTIGGPEADDDASFYEKFGTIRVDSDGSGNIYVMDSGNVRIQVFDRDGNYIRSLGGEGEGPGEFQIMGRMSVNEKGQAAVFDMAQGRVTVLEPTGELAYDVVVGEIRDVCLDDSGIVYVGYGDYGPAAVEAYGTNGRRIWSAGKNKKPGDRVFDFTLGSQTIAPRLEVLGSGGVFRSPKGEYLIQRFTTAGGEEGGFRRPFARQEINFEEAFPKPKEGEDGPQVVMIKKEETDGPGGPSSKTTASTSGEGVDFERLKRMMPKHHPDTKGVLAWPDGRLWIVTAEKRGGGVVTDEWSADGRYLRRFEVSGEYDWLQVGSDGTLYGVTHDEDDYPMAHRIQVKTGA